MRAYELLSYDGPDGLALSDVPEPSVGAGDLLVRVEAIGVNFPDLLLTRGQYQLKPPLPFVPGCELAGTVVRASGNDWQEGDRVAAFVWQGAFAEFAVVPAAKAARIPTDIDSVSAAAMVVNYQTVMFALERRARLRKGETVLVLGAGGGIGTAALQVARGLGARVIAGVKDEQTAQTARAAGAEEVVILTPGYAPVIKELAGGVDVVVDPVGGWLFDEAIRCLRPEGRLIVIGFAAGEIPTVAVNRLLLRNISVVGAAFGAFLDLEPQLVGIQQERIWDLFGAGMIKPAIDSVVSFEDLPQALHRLGAGEVRGKAVVSLR